VIELIPIAETAQIEVKEEPEDELKMILFEQLSSSHNVIEGGIYNLDSSLSANLKLILTVSNMCFALVTKIDDEGTIAVTVLDVQEDREGSRTGRLLKTEHKLRICSEDIRARPKNLYYEDRVSVDEITEDFDLTMTS